MWTTETRRVYERPGLRYPSDLTDEEWALVEPLIPPAERGGRQRTVDVRDVLNGVYYVLMTGCQWRALPKDLPPRSTVHEYLGLWEWDGTLARIDPSGYDAGKKVKGKKRCWKRRSSLPTSRIGTARCRC
jgi:transposase